MSSKSKPIGRLCDQHRLPGMVSKNACTNCEQLKLSCISLKKSVKKWKVAALRAQKRVMQLRKSTQKKKTE
jgi:hypothetical protein